MHLTLHVAVFASLGAMAVCTNNAGSSFPVRMTHSAAGQVLGGGCIWESGTDCPAGSGCGGVEDCREIAFPTYACNKEGWIVKYDTFPPDKYYSCVNTLIGLTECGLPVKVACGVLEGCGYWCTRGTPVGAIEPGEPPHCILVETGDNEHDSHRASGSFCDNSSSG